MEQVLAGLPLIVCLVYLDDILVSDCTFEQELENLRVVFLRLKEVKLSLAPKKCSSSRKSSFSATLLVRKSWLLIQINCDL